MTEVAAGAMMRGMTECNETGATWCDEGRHEDLLSTRALRVMIGGHERLARERHKHSVNRHDPAIMT